MRAAPCVRSGFCCLKATCAVGNLHGAPARGRCPFLRGDRPGFFSCGLIDDGTIDGSVIYAGAGCSSSLNTDRRIAVENNPAMKELPYVEYPESDSR